MPTPTRPATSAGQKLQAILYPEPVFLPDLGRPCLLPACIQNVMIICGHRGAGKSFLAATATDPNKMCYLDYERKGSDLHRQLNFGYYESVNDTVVEHAGRLIPIELYRRTWQVIEAMPKDRFSVIVLDNINELQKGMLSEVKDRPARYDVDQQKAMSGAYGGAWPGVHNLISGLSSYVGQQKGVQLIIVVSHLKPAWGNGQPLFNKFKTDGVARLHELSTLSLVMVPGVTPPTPSALVQKEQTGEVVFDPETGVHGIKRRLPLKLPRATWAEIRRYLREPADFNNPKPGEVPSLSELEPYSPTFSNEQLKAITAAAEAGMLADPVEETE